MQAEAGSSTLARQVVVTLSVLALYVLGQRVLLPGLELSELPAFVARSRFSLVALGLTPWIVGWLLVEVFTLFPGPGDKLRHGGWTGRQALNRASMVAGLVLALLQSMMFAVSVEGLNSSFSSSLLVPNPGWAFRVPFVLTLTAASAALFWLGTVVTRWGIGQGFSLLLLLQLGLDAGGQVTATDLGSSSPLALEPGQILLQGLGALALAAGMVVYQRSVESQPSGKPETALAVDPDDEEEDGAEAEPGEAEPGEAEPGEVEGEAEWKPAPVPPRWAVAFPQSLLAIPLAGLVLRILFGGASSKGLLSGLPFAEKLGEWGPVNWIGSQVVMVALLAWLGFRLFSGRGRLAAELPPAPEGRPPLAAELASRFPLSTLLLVLGSAGLAAWSLLHPGPWATLIDGVRLGLLVTIPWDLASQWSFTRTHGRVATLCTLNNVHLAPELVSRLEAAGIPATLQGFRHRALFFSYLPLVQIGVLVPEDRLEEAQARLAELDLQVV